MTETCGVASITFCDEPRDVRLNSAGTPIPSQQLRIVEDEREQPAGVQGEIQLRGAILTRYLDDELNARAFTQDGWFRTGDWGWLDEGGRLHYAGRRTDIFTNSCSRHDISAIVRR